MPRATKEKLFAALLVRMTPADKQLVAKLAEEWDRSEAWVVRLGIHLCEKLRRQRLARRRQTRRPS